MRVARWPSESNVASMLSIWIEYRDRGGRRIISKGKYTSIHGNDGQRRRGYTQNASLNERIEYIVEPSRPEPSRE